MALTEKSEDHQGSILSEGDMNVYIDRQTDTANHRAKPLAWQKEITGKTNITITFVLSNIPNNSIFK